MRKLTNEQENLVVWSIRLAGVEVLHADKEYSLVVRWPVAVGMMSVSEVHWNMAVMRVYDGILAEVQRFPGGPFSLNMLQHYIESKTVNRATNKSKN